MKGELYNNNNRAIERHHLNCLPFLDYDCKPVPKTPHFTHYNPYDFAPCYDDPLSRTMMIKWVIGPSSGLRPARLA